MAWQEHTWWQVSSQRMRKGSSDSGGFWPLHPRRYLQQDVLVRCRKRAVSLGQPHTNETQISQQQKCSHSMGQLPLNSHINANVALIVFAAIRALSVHAKLIWGVSFHLPNNSAPEIQTCKLNESTVRKVVSKWERGAAGKTAKQKTIRFIAISVHFQCLSTTESNPAHAKQDLLIIIHWWLATN